MDRRTDLPDYARALLDPAIYDAMPGKRVDRVDLVETHISWVFLAGDRVYKLRRPVAFGFLDFTTRGRRRRDCFDEVRLNRRLAPDVYLGVVRVTERAGRFAIEGRGRVVDHLVVMRRLPAESFLDAILDAGTATAADLEAVARALVGFHEQASADRSVARFGRAGVLRATWRETFDHWAPWAGTVLASDEEAELRRFIRLTLRRLSGAIADRVADQRIREGHGDLRAVQVAIEAGRPLILDCVEFSKRLRSLDVIADVAFLAMDLDARRRSDLASVFVRAYLDGSGDYAAVVLLPFYLAQRAAVRAEIALLRSAQLHGPAQRHAEGEARTYFDLLLHYIRDRPQPFLAITSGLSGSGKSTLAGELARGTGARIVASDLVRKRLAGLRGLERAPTELYSAEWTARTYTELFASARRSLRRGRSVILDATFLAPEQRLAARAIALAAGARFACFETVLSRAETRRRLARRAAKGHSVSDADWTVFLAQRRTATSPTELPPTEWIRVAMATNKTERLTGPMRLLMEPLLIDRNQRGKQKGDVSNVAL